MPSLRDLQSDFWRAIASDPGTLAAGDGLLALTEPSVTLDSGARLQVYADAYFWRLRDVLVEDYPRLAALLGTEPFEELARAYLHEHPSVQPSVRHLGDAFPAFVATRTDLPPYLGDLARLERARTDVFDGPDDTPLAAADLRAIEPGAWPGLRLSPIRALVVLHLEWPVHALWGDVHAVPSTPASTILRIWRGKDYRVFHAPMEPQAALALEHLVAGEPFGVVCGAFDDLAAEEGARQASALLARWLEDGMIAGVAID